MKEHPILFKTEMVKAILDGYKTQTRRVVKLPKTLHPVCDDDNADDLTSMFHCPYGNSQDRLWVRETWAHDDPNCKDIRCGNRDHIWWKANEEKIVADSFAGSARWHPSMSMPHWASRISLEILNVRVERLQDITQKDAAFEGVPLPAYGKYPITETAKELIEEFRILWDSINAKRGFGWDTNPWVWRIEFRRIKP